jgi:hypothetical protein
MYEEPYMLSFYMCTSASENQAQLRNEPWEDVIAQSISMNTEEV